MKKLNQLGILFDAACSKKIMILSKEFQTDPRKYIIDLVNKEYEEYEKSKLIWEGDDE